MEAAIAAVDADIADSVLTPEETTSQQLFNHLFEDHTKDNKLCPEHQAFYTDTGEECNLENKKEKRKKEEKMKGHLDIINTIDTFGWSNCRGSYLGHLSVGKAIQYRRIPNWRNHVGAAKF